MSQHPEQRSDEVFVSNMDEERPWPWLPHPHFRVGRTAYDIGGKLALGMRPVFAYRSEMHPDVITSVDTRNRMQRYWPH